jgi:hypothetical protein
MGDTHDSFDTDELAQNSEAALQRFNRPLGLREERAMRREMVAAIIGLIGVLLVVAWALAQ